MLDRLDLNANEINNLERIREELNSKSKSLKNIEEKLEKREEKLGSIEEKITKLILKIKNKEQAKKEKQTENCKIYN